MLIQIKPDAPTQHAQFVLVCYYRLSARLGQPVRQQLILHHLGIEMWINRACDLARKARKVFQCNGSNSEYLSRTRDSHPIGLNSFVAKL